MTHGQFTSLSNFTSNSAFYRSRWNRKKFTERSGAIIRFYAVGCWQRSPISQNFSDDAKSFLSIFARRIELHHLPGAIRHFASHFFRQSILRCCADISAENNCIYRYFLQKSEYNSFICCKYLV